jgi:tRNA dimethylallyltransferase
MKRGAVEEVKKLLELNLHNSLPIMRAHGVPEIMKYLANEINLEECINKGQQVTRNYVKRQHTWWNSSKLQIFKQFDAFPSEIDINSIKID